MNTDETKIQSLSKTAISTNNRDGNEEAEYSSQAKPDFAEVQDAVWCALWPYQYCSLRRLKETRYVNSLPRLDELISDPKNEIPTAIMNGEKYAYMPKVVELLQTTLYPQE